MSASFKRQNNYMPSAWFPAAMRLRNVRVGLNNNSLFLMVASEKDSEVNLQRTLYVAVFKRLARAP
jgi:hypothetical protein